MKVVVADRKGIVSAAIRTSFLSRKSSAEVISARNWSRVYDLVRSEERMVVVSAELIEGMKSNKELWRTIKLYNPNVIFVVYNGVDEKYDKEDGIHFFIPSFGGDKVITPGQYIADFLLRNVFKGEEAMRQGVLPFASK